MKDHHTNSSQTREALGLLVRPVSDGGFAISRHQRAKARSIARQIDGSRTANPRTVAPMFAALAAFGGHITAFEISGQ